MTDKEIIPHPPSVHSNNFNCPHCGSHSSQTWFRVATEHIRDCGTPNFLADEFIEMLESETPRDDELIESFQVLKAKIEEGLVFFERNKSGSYYYETVWNLHLSSCYTCKKVSVWVHDKLIFPEFSLDLRPNSDLPDDIKTDFIEAVKIHQSSPRGAAALLRLCIQKLCKHLGEKGENINNDIAALVKKGLDTRVQKALDIVRVIGNNAVHPGKIDIKDDSETVSTLFKLVNLVAEKMISEPKHIDSLFDGLPQSVQKSINKRDEK